MKNTFIKIIKYFFLSLFSLICIILGHLYLFSYLNPCNLPIKYSLGNVDNRFGISDTQLLETLNDAAQRWNESFGKDVFLFQNGDNLKINLVYDQRQEHLDEVNEKLSEINSSANSIEEFEKQTESRISQYNTDLQEYNSEVNYWNSLGGAPEGIYERLNQEKVSLDKTKELIESSTALLDQMIEEHNDTVGDFNTQNEEDNNKLFTQGLYYKGENKIDIFTFGNYNELRLVLMHEVGHSLSTDHDQIETSIMYPILQKQNMENPIPSKEDINMMNGSCKISNLKFDNKFYRYIQKFNFWVSSVLDRVL